MVRLLALTIFFLASTSHAEEGASWWCPDPNGRVQATVMALYFGADESAPNKVRLGVADSDDDWDYFEGKCEQTDPTHWECVAKQNDVYGYKTILEQDAKNKLWRTRFYEIEYGDFVGEVGCVPGNDPDDN